MSIETSYINICIHICIYQYPTVDPHISYVVIFFAPCPFNDPFSRDSGPAARGILGPLRALGHRQRFCFSDKTSEW